MKRIAIFLSLSVCVIALSTSCKKNTVAACNNNFNFASELSNEAVDLSNAASAYGQNPTTQNCNAYVDAFNAYLDAARDLEDCAQRAGQGAEYIQAINDAQASLDQLQC